MFLKISWLSAFLLSALLLPLGAEAGYQIKPLPAWVNPVKEPLPGFGDPLESSYGYSFSFSDFQADISGTPQFLYRSRVKIDNEDGLTNLGQLSWDFDPEYERLTVHYIQVTRGSQVISQLDRAQFKLIQRESSMEYLIYDGSKTLNIILSDLRVGDVLEYAYTITGNNPVFDGHVFLERALQFYMPVPRLSVRVRTRKDQNLFFKIKGSELDTAGESLKPFPLEFTRTPGQDYTDYLWIHENVPEPVSETSLPDWENAVPLLQIGTMKDWDEVQAWAHKLFQPYATAPASVKKLTLSLVEGLEDPKEKIDKVIRFVQKEVRYLGLELGAHAYKPHPVAETLSHRFGDCKDKSLLLHVMLSVLGVSSDLILVNTYKERFTSAQLPAITAFNHVILGVETPQGTVYVDATNSSQEGMYDQREPLSFGQGLVIRPLGAAKGGIVDFPARINTPLLTRVEVNFKLPREWDEAGTMDVASFYSGTAAESMRSSFKGNSLTGMEKSFLEFYAYQFPDIGTRERLEFTDLPTGDLSLRESYEIPSIWDVGSVEEKGNFSYYPMLISEPLNKTKLNKRKHPLALPYPMKIQERVVFDLPPYSWGIEKEKPLVVETGFLRFSMESSYQKNQQTMIYTLETLQDHVPPRQIAEYNKTLDEIYDNISYRFFPDMKKLAAFDPTQQQEELEEAPAEEESFGSLVGGLVVLFFLFRIGRKLYLKNKGLR